MRKLAASRRSLLSGALAAPIWFGTSAAARKRGKGRPKPKAKPNEFGCLNVGSACKRGGQCCSGICQGKKGKKRCRAHDTGSCRAGELHEVCGGADVACTTSGGQEGICTTTTGNAGYCAASGSCHECRTDAACARCELCENVGGTICVFPERLPETINGLAALDPHQDDLSDHRATREERP